MSALRVHALARRSASASSSSCSWSTRTTTTWRARRRSARAAGEEASSRRGEARDHREHDRAEQLDPRALRRPARRARGACATRCREAAGVLNLRRRRRRRAPVPQLARAAHLPDRALPVRASSATATSPSSSPCSASTSTSAAPSGDDAVYLMHMLTRYMPHFIALSAASPFYQGVDTAFESSRLTAVNAFPLVGPHAVRGDWAEFVELLRHHARLRHRREHEGLLLGHPPQARVRHDRDPRLRHAAHRRRARRARRLRAGAGRWLPRRAAASSRRAAVYLVNSLQPLRGLPLRPARRAGGAVRAAAQGASARTSSMPSRMPCRTRGGWSAPSALATLAAEVRARTRTRAGCARSAPRAARSATWCARPRNAGRRA